MDYLIERSAQSWSPESKQQVTSQDPDSATNLIVQLYSYTTVANTRTIIVVVKLEIVNSWDAVLELSPTKGQRNLKLGEAGGAEHIRYVAACSLLLNF